MRTLDERTSADPFAHVRQQLQPALVRSKALEEVDRMFEAGGSPAPPPDGFLPGSLLTTSVSRSADALARGLSKMYMPWLGKRFDAEGSTGTNVLKASARSQMKLLWPSYEPRRADARLEAFDFRTRLAPGELNPAVQVMKIDYDIETNPNFVIRKILDELVQVDAGIYLGKILFRWRESWTPIGYFELRTTVAE